MFNVITLVNRKITAGKLVTVEQFYIGDAEEAPVSGKMHNTVEEAQAELAGLGYFAEGLEFAKAQFPDISEKAQKGKANVIADFLKWVAEGKPVVEPKSTEVTEEEVAEVAEELSEEVDF